MVCVCIYIWLETEKDKFHQERREVLFVLGREPLLCIKKPIKCVCQSFVLLWDRSPLGIYTIRYGISTASEKQKVPSSVP